MNNVKLLALGIGPFLLSPALHAETLTRPAKQDVAAFAVSVAEWKPLKARDREVLQKLLPAYPEEIIGLETSADGTVKLAMRSGEKVVLDDLKSKTQPERLENSDVEDMFADAYPQQLPEKKWPFALDPGRYRSAAFFKAVYGKNEKDVAKNLTTVKFCGSNIQFNKLNGGATALTAVADDLAKLQASNPKVSPYLKKLGGGFNWRQIAGTESLSAHSFGIAIDLNPDLGGYWKWDKGDASDMKRRTDYPAEIISIFEKHGFVWGGKWYHFDLMHFEYRPELAGQNMSSAPVAAVASPEAIPVDSEPEPEPVKATKTAEPSVSELLFQAAFDVSPYKEFTLLSKIEILRLVQSRLRYEGYYTKAIDGKFTDDTQAAIRNWQQEEGLASNGLLDEQTLTALGLAKLKETKAPPPPLDLGNKKKK